MQLDCAPHSLLLSFLVPRETVNVCRQIADHCTDINWLFTWTQSIGLPIVCIRCTVLQNIICSPSWCSPSVELTSFLVPAGDYPGNQSSSLEFIIQLSSISSEHYLLYGLLCIAEVYGCCCCGQKLFLQHCVLTNAKAECSTSHADRYGSFSLMCSPQWILYRRRR